MLKEDFTPGFYVKHFIKDMTIAEESARDLGMETPGLTLAKPCTNVWPTSAVKTTAHRRCSNSGKNRNTRGQ